MSPQFTDEEFQSAWRELDEPRLEGGWELFVETMGVKIYRLYDKETRLYEYKVFGVLATCTAELCADVYMDLAYRKHWDSYVKELYETDFSGQTAIYWQVKYPFPLSNRDYVYVRERRDLEVDGRTVRVVLARSAPDLPCAESGGVLRVKDYKQSVALESDGGCGTKVFMNYFDNPGGNIPTWLVNWAAGTGVPDFLTNMQKACSKYGDYRQKK
ncbi:phosphatidylcholine transfer protein [Cyclopterus lumpus]|uniref:Phosphatidylcholine transfer protein n=1 Tax=Cyclopterus lumpus TaxID=8103 RepID=A0A8C2YX53_CYCLU|nr:phosphatidylcholine transfer protein [Cyclopterus lumpus]XP_034395821.1 phosphatidylcholine transfer protein [Cyclopterus lumpus]XP_034395822.1 phosphatidylcholine transfer protein [Cyclopterus lumpus]